VEKLVHFLKTIRGRIALAISALILLLAVLAFYLFNSAYKVEQLYQQSYLTVQIDNHAFLANMYASFSRSLVQDVCITRVGGQVKRERFSMQMRQFKGQMDTYDRDNRSRLAAFRCLSKTQR